MCVLKIKLLNNMLHISLGFRTLISKRKAVLWYSVASKLQSQQMASSLRYEKYSSLLENYGFNPGQISRLFKSEHSVLCLSKNELLSNLMTWLKFEQNDKLFSTLSAYPELLNLNPACVDFRVEELMKLFTRKDINKLLNTCPRVFLDDFSEIYDKMEYLVHFMKAEQKSIVKSCALQFDFYHIKCRHAFVTRAGYYTTKKDGLHKNPPLNKIFSRNMQTFLKLTQLTEEEYTVFARCYEDEIDIEDENEDDYFYDGEEN